jgi:hypothetical protein
MRHEVFTAVKIKVDIFRVVTLCSFVVGYQCFGGPCCLHLQGKLMEKEEHKCKWAAQAASQ